ncbi:glutamate-5-semialdehyde dehydrogenase [Acidithrix ferrooxidans]|uniref:Gamma-glutamyl phosphate reductase n=1 Tax=Acidithrix ferrooxidans TaxID=1280514 RepID=A0A0D8HM05_9ACTN|nr:glutamate-5-semialdehyde dehydrogenase [Acidithrix ferrooxidans]KJF18859.1 gamma-glutamyl phosphate reductase [Acidithrix ferrooxidans]
MEPSEERDLSLEELAQGAKSATQVVATASTSTKNAALAMMAQEILAHSDEILAANEIDLKMASELGLASTAIDRLRLDHNRVLAMAQQIKEIIKLPDPIGQVTSGYRLANGLNVRKVRVPLGVVGIIYENRPNVTSDAGALCLKSGNVALLRGSSAAINSNRVIATLLRGAIGEVGLSPDVITLIPFTDRASAGEFMRLNGKIDLLIPRGGRSLVEAIKENATVPYVIDGDGNCHIYVDESANIEMAIEIIENSKVQRPGVCNAVETVLIHTKIARQLLSALDERLSSVQLRGDLNTTAIVPRALLATDDDYATEFLDLVLAVKIVDDMPDAIDHIRRFGTGHSEAIITESYANANYFCERVDAAAVLVNASTRFVDGNQLGLGAEIGISTQKLHARGPMGLVELTTEKYVIEGSGQVRS